jgi:hypothetical protein
MSEDQRPPTTAKIDEFILVFIPDPTAISPFNEEWTALDGLESTYWGINAPRKIRF